MFKKPRRHFRQRKLTDGSDHEDEDETNDENQVVTTKPKSNTTKGKPSKQPDKPISFDIDGIEGEGEVMIAASRCRLIKSHLLAYRLHHLLEFVV